ncbi:MAG: hypothetical protein U0746_02705 [Gemmataceae bacterium]
MGRASNEPDKYVPGTTGNVENTQRSRSSTIGQSAKARPEDAVAITPSVDASETAQCFPVGFRIDVRLVHYLIAPEPLTG